MEEIILRERELRENIVQEINNSNLPAFIIKPIFKDMLMQLEQLEAQQYEQAKANKKKENKKKGEK